MKTPWRFLTDLVSKKPSDQPEEKPQDENAAAASHQAQEHANSEAAPTSQNVETARDLAEVDRVVDLPLDTTGSDNVPVARAGKGAGVKEPIADESQPDEDTAGIAVVVPANEEDAVSPTPSVPAVSEVQETGASQRPKAPRRKSPIATEPKVIVAPPNPPEIVAYAPKSDFEKMTELDAEIGDLRIRLAERLLAQNEQLRQMLKRYDRT
jgi:hypothetical protein